MPTGGVGDHLFYATIDGPYQISSGQQATWGVDVEGGSSPYSYKWYKDGVLDGTSQFYSTSDNQSFNLLLQIDESGGDSDTDSRYIHVGPYKAIPDSNKTLVQDKEPKSYEFSLSSYPNPFNPSTTVSYSLPERAEVSLEVYNIMGRRITTLINASRQAGEHTIRFEASDLASGIYFGRLVAEGISGTIWQDVLRMQLIK